MIGSGSRRDASGAETRSLPRPSRIVGGERAERRSTPAAMLSTLEVLRGQVRALADSADDAEETARAAAWSKKLDAATHAAELLSAPGSTAKQRKVLKKQVDGLREEIFAAYVTELDEDARKDAGAAP